MQPRNFVRVKTTDRTLERIQAGVSALSSCVSNCNLIDGALLSNIQLLAAGTTLVPHLLKRIPEGWIVVGIDANSVVWEVSKDANCLGLNCSANAVVSLWVF